MRTYKVHLSFCVLMSILLLSCTGVSGEYEITTFDLGQGRSIEILASEDAEVTQSFYYQVKVDQKIVVPLYMICVGHDRGQLKFKTLLAKDGNVVGIFEQKYPQEILAIHDFTSNATWPQQYGAALLEVLQAEHQDMKLKLATGRACE